MDFFEKTILKKEIFKGKIIDVSFDTVELPNGHTSTRELVYHPGGVGVICIDDARRVLLVRQFRKPLEKVIEEIPAGKLDKGEHHKCAATRELEEETGYTAENLTYLGGYYASPGFCDEVIHIYLATGLKQTLAHPDEDEFVEVFWEDLDSLYKKAIQGQIMDGKTAIAVLAAKNILG